MCAMNRATYSKAFILVIALLVSLLFLYMISGFLMALLIAALFAGMLYPGYRWAMARSQFLAARPGMTAAGIVLLAVIAVGLPFVGFVGMVSAQAVTVAATVANNVTPWVRDNLFTTEGIERISAWIPFYEHIEPYRDTILSRLGQVAGEVGGLFVRSGTALTRSTFNFLLNLFVMFYAMYFFLCRGKDWIVWLSGYLPLTDHDRQEVLNRGLTVTRATLKGIFIIGVLQGTLIGLAFGVLGIPGALFWGTVVVVLSALPALGPPVVWVPATIYLAVSGQIGAAIGLAVWGTLVVGVLDNVLRPRIIGAETRLPDLLIFLSMLGGIGLFGVFGLIIGPIIAAVMSTTLDIYRYAFITELPGER
jgi:predicted PurR-regulated permease PerM